MDTEVIIIRKDLPNTALNAKHPRALEMKRNVEETAAAEGGTVCQTFLFQRVTHRFESQEKA